MSGNNEKAMKLHLVSKRHKKDFIYIKILNFRAIVIIFLFITLNYIFVPLSVTLHARKNVKILLCGFSSSVGRYICFF